MKKCIILMLTTLCMIIATAMPVGATNDLAESKDLAGIIEIGPHPGHENNTANSIEEIECDAIVNEMIRTRIDTYIPTAEDYTRAQEVLDFYNKVNSPSNGDLTTSSSFDDNWWKLRYGNLIELTLDYDEGISNSVALSCTNLSRDAEKEAKDHFPNYWDSGQHFMWNFMMVKEQSKTIARTIANNHEWGITIINPMLNHFESAYNEYIAKGYSESNASNKALADTIVYIPVFKYDAVSIMESSYSFFKSFFSDESIMDFWNNCFGRVYPEKGYNDAVTAFDYAAFTADELVLDGKTTMAENLTEAQRKNVWEWDWYS